MTCEEIIKRLYDTLNSGVENITSEVMAEHYKLCQTCCSYCKFDAQVIKAMQDNCFQATASTGLRSKIMEVIDLAQSSDKPNNELSD